jgi:hypothetical protein
MSLQRLDLNARETRETCPTLFVVLGRLLALLGSGASRELALWILALAGAVAVLLVAWIVAVVLMVSL